MDFLLEPLEPGTDFDKLIDFSTTIECNQGYACNVGKVEIPKV